MKKYTILYIGRNIEILNTVVRLLNANEDWLGIGALDNVIAKLLFKEHTIEVVLLGAGISEESELNLRSFFAEVNPTAVVVQHYGGGSGLLSSEINQALEEYNKKRECFSN
jgi:Mg2+/Co2+ transporter CorC